MSEIRLEDGEIGGLIECPSQLVPAPGQYLAARRLDDLLSPLPQRLFSAGCTPGGFRFAPPLPAGWTPGIDLFLRGPLGNGFNLPTGLRRLAIASLSGSWARLLPLVEVVLPLNVEVTLYGTHASRLPPAVEVLPLADLPGALEWADFLALEAPLAELEKLPQALGLGAGDRLLLEAQVLIHTSMPCMGIAECGVCSVRTRRGWKLACKDGPVFEWSNLWI